jgi:hypothetical protein
MSEHRFFRTQADADHLGRLVRAFRLLLKIGFFVPFHLVFLPFSREWSKNHMLRCGIHLQAAEHSRQVNKACLRFWN